MTNTPGENALTLQPNDKHVGTGEPAGQSEQQALSQHVQALTAPDTQQRVASDAQQQAAPTGMWEKFEDTTKAGIKHLPEGFSHAFSAENILKNGVISIATGAAAKVLLPETGALGKVFAVGLGAYFGTEAAIPVWNAYADGQHAKTMGEIDQAGAKLGDATAGIAVNAPIGIIGYKVGEGIGSNLLKNPTVADFAVARDAALQPFNDRLTTALQPVSDTLSGTVALGKSKFNSLRSGIFDFLHRDGSSDANTGNVKTGDSVSTDATRRDANEILKGRVEKTDKPSGFDQSHMDLNTKPGDNFYRFSNGKWEDNMQIPPTENQYGTFNELIKRSDDSVHDIVEAAANDKTAAPGSNQQKMGDFYRTGMDTAGIDAAGAKPIEAELAKINGISNLTDMSSVLADMHSKGTGGLFSLGAALDPGDSTQMIATLGQGGLSMPRDFYVNGDEGSVKLRAGLQEHAQKVFQLAGDDQATATAKAARLMDVETKLAKLTIPDGDLRDPMAIYNKMSVADLQKMTPNFDWNTYLKGMNAEHVTDVNVLAPDYFKAQNDFLGNTSLDDLKTYLQFHQIKDASPYLSSDFVNEHFNFFGKQLGGTEEQAPRWQQVVDATNDALPEAVGEKYVERNFSPEAKAKMVGMVNKLKDSMRRAINKSDMTEATRTAALEKIDKMGVKIGYPDKWKDYSKLDIDGSASFYDNAMRAKQFAVADNISSIGKPVDRSVWGMSPQTVNAYYDPSMNEVVFPAAILQPPYFDLAADDATNLGAIGATIGHEITHGFDDQGSLYDANGNLRKWMQDVDFDNFMKTIQKIRDQYDQYTIPSGAHVKGENVSGEAAADLGGANVAYGTLRDIYGDKYNQVDETGYTPEQRFFVAFAQSFATKYRPEALEAQVAGNEHPPDFIRVNGTVGNMSAFKNAFGLGDDAPVMVPPDKRANLWESAYK